MKRYFSMGIVLLGLCVEISCNQYNSTKEADLSKTKDSIVQEEFAKPETSAKEKLIGKWIFDRFDFPNFISPDSKQAKDANKLEKGLEIKFTTDGKCISSQPNGLKENNATNFYELQKDNKHLVIKKDTLEIDTLNEESLVLYEEGRPTITFKRKK